MYKQAEQMRKSAEDQENRIGADRHSWKIVGEAGGGIEKRRLV